MLHAGGWKMKLALARAMLLEAGLLLLDEPTNHMDTANVQWLQRYLLSCGTTLITVSHDSGFLDSVCTGIIHYENKKLAKYRGNLSAFVEQKPEAKAYYELTDEFVKFRFPIPGPLDGVKCAPGTVPHLSHQSLCMVHEHRHTRCCLLFPSGAWGTCCVVEWSLCPCLA